MSGPHPPACSEMGLPDPAPLTTEHFVRVAKALAHPARIRILQQFAECQPHIVQEIVAGCDLAQSTVSEHLRILREAEVVFTTRDGPRTWYCVRRSVLHSFARAVHALAEQSPLVRVG